MSVVLIRFLFELVVFVNKTVCGLLNYLKFYSLKKKNVINKRFAFLPQQELRSDKNVDTSFMLRAAE